MAIQHETELYPPIKQFLENRGFIVRSEVQSCDVVAIHPDEQEPVIVELKRTFTLSLLLQAVERLKVCERVYVAVERTRSKTGSHNQRWNEIAQLCKRIGIGMLLVTFYASKKPLVDILCEPEPYSPKQITRRRHKLLREFHSRSGDYNVGGSTRRKLTTAYREQSLHCVYLLHKHGTLSPKQLKELTGNNKISSFLQKNVYGWYVRLSRGRYTISPSGVKAIEQYHDVLEAMNVSNEQDMAVPQPFA